MATKKFIVCFKHNQEIEVKEFRINESHVEELESKILESLMEQGYYIVNILAIKESQYITTSQL